MKNCASDEIPISSEIKTTKLCLLTTFVIKFKSLIQLDTEREYPAVKECEQSSLINQ